MRLLTGPSLGFEAKFDAVESSRKLSFSTRSGQPALAMFQLRLCFQLDLPFTATPARVFVERRSGIDRRGEGRSERDRRRATAN